MSVLKLCAKGGIVIGLIVLSGCGSEELVQNKQIKIDKSAQVNPKIALSKKVTETSAQTSRVIARVMNPKVLLKKNTKWGGRFNWQSQLYEERRNRHSSTI